MHWIEKTVCTERPTTIGSMRHSSSSTHSTEGHQGQLCLAAGPRLRRSCSVPVTPIAVWPETAWPRLSLAPFPAQSSPPLAYAHRKACDDELASSIADAATNRDRATLVGDAILNGTPLQLTSDTDRLAEQRLKKILQEPRAALLDIEQHAKLDEASASEPLHRRETGLEPDARPRTALRSGEAVPSIYSSARTELGSVPIPVEIRMA